MLFPEEVVASRVLPTFRAMVAKGMAEQGLSERAIAERLGVTQSAVSKYLRGRYRVEAPVAASANFRALADRLSKGLADETTSAFEALGEAAALIRREEDRGLICRLHEAAVPGLAGLGCDLCVRAGASDLLSRQEVLGDLRAALGRLEATPGFASLIPNVGSNLARARPGARSFQEVAAVPGRIFEMRGAVRVPAAPEFGASRHVAQVALAVMSEHAGLQAALNVAATPEVLEAAERLGWALVEFDASYEGRGDKLARALRGRRKAPDGLFHVGAFGVEPVLYLVAPTALDVVERARELSTAVLQRPAR